MSERRVRAAAEAEGERRFGDNMAVAGFVAGALWHRARGGDFAEPMTPRCTCDDGPERGLCGICGAVAVEDADVLRAEVERLRAENAQAWDMAAEERLCRLEAEADRADTLAELAGLRERVEALAAEYDRDDADHLVAFGQHHPVAAVAAERIRALLAADEAGEGEGRVWECSHRPRCADAACSDNPAMQAWILGAPAPSPALASEHRKPYPADLYPGCPCARCDLRPVMNLCPACGDKRCSGAKDHDQHPTDGVGR